VSRSASRASRSLQSLGGTLEKPKLVFIGDGCFRPAPSALEEPRRFDPTALVRSCESTSGALDGHQCFRKVCRKPHSGCLSNRNARKKAQRSCEAGLKFGICAEAEGCAPALYQCREDAIGSRLDEIDPSEGREVFAGLHDIAGMRITCARPHGPTCESEAACRPIMAAACH
jgi:hypothetical protein